MASLNTMMLQLHVLHHDDHKKQTNESLFIACTEMTVALPSLAGACGR
jgi:hypothetical protein